MQNHSNRIDALISAPTPYLTDGGLETTLIFHYGYELPCFAAFPLLDTIEGRAHLKEYYQSFVDVAKASATGFVLDVPVWRASPDWGAQLGYDQAALDRINLEGAQFARDMRLQWQTRETPIVINGVVGPRGDGYVIDKAMTEDEAAAFHTPQLKALKLGGAEMVTAVTMTYVAEAIGIARAAIDHGIPVVISFTVETDGALPSGQSLQTAIAEVDAATEGGVLYFMINCAHPDHYCGRVAGDDTWLNRIGGLRSNASRMSHAELDDAVDLDAGDPEEFGQLHRDLMAALPNISVVGGCCGTDHRHVACVVHDHAHSCAA